MGVVVDRVPHRGRPGRLPAGRAAGASTISHCSPRDPPDHLDQHLLGHHEQLCFANHPRPIASCVRLRAEPTGGSDSRRDEALRGRARVPDADPDAGQLHVQAGIRQARARVGGARPEPGGSRRRPVPAGWRRRRAAGGLASPTGAGGLTSPTRCRRADVADRAGRAAVGAAGSGRGGDRGWWLLLVGLRAEPGGSSTDTQAPGSPSCTSIPGNCTTEHSAWAAPEARPAWPWRRRRTASGRRRRAAPARPAGRSSRSCSRDLLFEGGWWTGTRATAASTASSGSTGMCQRKSNALCTANAASTASAARPLRVPAAPAQPPDGQRAGPGQHQTQPDQPGLRGQLQVLLMDEPGEHRDAGWSR